MGMMKGNIGSLLRETADRMRAQRAEEKPAPEPIKTPEEIKAALLARYRDLPPPKLSPELCKKLGVTRVE